MANTRVSTIDLHFQNKKQAIASYLIRQDDAVILIESGPASTLPTLETALAALGLSLRDITHVLLTHIHLDHAGAAGQLAKQGAQIYVHPLGAPHLIQPEKLIASASRIYGDRMNQLWGEILPVAQNQIYIPNDTEEFTIGNLKFLPIHTAGHAEHHYSYLFEDICFCGDVGGVRIPGYPYLRVPMPPPEFHFAKWRESIDKLKKLNSKQIAPTHFGIYADVEWHLNTLQKNLDATETWLDEVMPNEPSLEELREQFTKWMEEQSREQGLSEEVIQVYTLSNPIGMSADGLLRYWNKYKNAK
ncbi:MAG: MBL fold metallo-hydrolase [Anaerolineales bacterium]|nr:MBL fold metallo-hydrolase [Anaerolineales bacterium]